MPPVLVLVLVLSVLELSVLVLELSVPLLVLLLDGAVCVLLAGSADGPHATNPRLSSTARDSIQ